MKLEELSPLVYRKVIIILLSVIILNSCYNKSPKVTDPTSDNKVPQVDAGENKTVLEQEQFVLSGTASDSDGFIRVYKWEQSNGPTAVLVSGANQQAASFIAPSATENITLRFKLLVIDNMDGRSEDFVEVNVRPVNKIPTISVAPENIIDQNTFIEIRAEFLDPDGYLDAIEWKQTLGPEVNDLEINTTDDKSVSLLSFTTPQVSQAEKIEFTVVATDNEMGLAQKYTSVTVLPEVKKVEISPTPRISNVSDSYNVVQLNIKNENEIENFEWKQTKGKLAKINNTSSSQLVFYAPEVESTEELQFKLHITDKNNNSLEHDVYVTIDPIMSIQLEGIVSSFPLHDEYSVVVNKLRQDLSLSQYSQTKNIQGPGEFSFYVPGEGLYQIIASEIKPVLVGETPPFENRVQGLYYLDSSLNHINVNILTDITHNRILSLITEKNLHPTDAIEQAESEFGKIVLQHDFNLPAPYSKYGFFESKNHSASSTLASFSVLMYNYAKTRITSQNSILALTDFLDSLGLDFSNDGEIDSSFFLLLENLTPSFDPNVFVNRAEAVSSNNLKAVNINESLDSDLDGIPNILDETFDGGVDYTIPFTETFSRPACSDKIFINPFDHDEVTLNIQSYWKLDQYVSVSKEQVVSAPIKSKHSIAGKWTISKIPELENHFSIKQTGTNHYLVLDVESPNNLNIKTIDEITENLSATWTFRDVDSNRKGFIYFISSGERPQYHISSHSQYEAFDGLQVNSIEARDDHLDRWLASRWLFCQTEEFEKTVEYVKETYAPPKCDSGELALGTNQSQTVMIRNYWKPDQFLNRELRLKSSPIYSNNWKNASWILKKGNNDNQFFIVSDLEDKSYLYFDPEYKSLKMSFEDLSPEERSWYIERTNNERTGVDYFHIYSATTPPFYLSIQKQAGKHTPGENANKVEARSDHTDSWHSSRWIICAKN